ncbi:hypothetical protein IYQ_16479 [Aeromonas salmonicida subsp. salmonicida 01-B526]|uniref:Uncharacterized protein n=1 Tax=Aeromonas salmonicida subsp. salmonicida 01-B526 TaxID=1076135 RepID=A0ABN0DXI2_AERSS|nr:hypothetical protein IYQ_16479 [Aeromonas salmonicida subsp. salmonicida 01-B526]
MSVSHFFLKKTSRQGLQIQECLKIRHIVGVDLRGQMSGWLDDLAVPLSYWFALLYRP